MPNWLPVGRRDHRCRGRGRARRVPGRDPGSAWIPQRVAERRPADRSTRARASWAEVRGISRWWTSLGADVTDALSHSDEELIVPTGQVRFFNAEKGFGFLTTEDGEDVFVHVSALPAGTTNLRQGTRVDFSVAEGRKGKQALSVTVLETPPSVVKAGRRPAEELARDPGGRHQVPRPRVQPAAQGPLPRRRQGPAHRRRCCAPLPTTWTSDRPDLAGWSGRSVSSRAAAPRSTHRGSWCSDRHDLQRNAPGSPTAERQGEPEVRGGQRGLGQSAGRR